MASTKTTATGGGNRVSRLFDSPDSRSLHVRFRFSRAVLKKIEKDFKRVVEMSEQRQHVPPVARLTRYVADEYGVVLSPTTVGRWLAKVKRGESICR